MKQIFINLPVHDLEKSMRFYLACGFTLNPLFTDEEQKCLLWSGAIYVMLQSKAFASSYMKKSGKEVPTESMVSHTLPVENAEQVDEILENALLAGGLEPVPALTEEFMYLRSIQDLDGNLWGIMHLDLAKFKALKIRDSLI